MSCWCLLLVFALAIGCGGDNDALAPVTGTVKNADGTPLNFESGMIIFQPVEGEKGASGGFDTDDSFTMMTMKPGDGMRRGNYKVVIQAWANYREQKLAVPDRYGSAATTPLEAQVDSDHTHFDFVVEK